MHLEANQSAELADLRAQREALTLVANQSSQLLVRCDREFRYLFVNAAYARRHGLRPGDIIGKKIADVVGEEAFATFRHFMEAAYRGEPQRFELRIPYLDLGDRFVHVEYTPERNEAGEVVGLIGSITDITATRAAELEQQKSEARLQSIIDNVEALVFAKDRDGRFILVNKNFEESLGMPRESMIGRKDRELFPEALAAVYEQHDTNVLSRGERRRVEETSCINGVTRDYLVSKFPLRNDSGGIDGVCGVATEITDLKRLQRNLQESEAQLKLALTAGRMAHWEWDLKTNRLYWSPLHYELMGYETTDFEPRYEHWASRVDPQDVKRCEKFVQECLQARTDYELEYRVLLPDGRLRWIQSRARFGFDENGTPSRLTGVMFDVTATKTIEEELRAREARSREQAALLDLAHDAIIVRDMDARVRYWNRAAQETYGWNAAEAAGRSTHELLQTRFPSDLWQIEAALIKGGFWEGELTHIRKDRTELVVDSRWALQRNENGEPVAVLEINRDITLRKIFEARLAEEQERLVAAIVAARAGTFRWNILTNELDWDEALDRLFGLPPGKTVRSLHAFIERVHTHDRGGVISRCERCAKEGVDFDMEFRVRWLDGTVHWLYDRGKTFLDQNGKPSYMTGACVDITERKETEQRLKALESRERTILEQLPLGVWFIDRDGKIIYGNKTGLEIWGGVRYVGSEEFGEYRGRWHRTKEVIKGEEWAGAKAFREKKPYLNELVDIETFDGREKTIINSAMPVTLPNGEFDGVVVFNLDVTEQARMQAELRRSHDELEMRVAERTAKLQETIEALEAFSYSMSHDMRSPLRSMQGFANALLEEHSQQLDQEGKDLLTRIERAAHRMDLLIMDVLAYGQVAKQQIELSAVSLDALVGELIRNYPSFQEPGASVKVCGELGMVVGHPAFLSQILTNLVANAVKFIEPGKKPEIQIFAERHDAETKIFVQDNGIGIEPRHAPRLFQMFGRIHSAKKYEGTGIGLAVVKKAVERLGGRIGFDSKPGVGTTFWFTVKTL